MRIRLNRKHTIEVSNIKYIIEKDECYWIYLKKGYPPILKSDESKYNFRNKCVNSGINLKDYLQ